MWTVTLDSVTLSCEQTYVYLARVKPTDKAPINLSGFELGKNENIDYTKGSVPGWFSEHFQLLFKTNLSLTGSYENKAVQCVF